MSLVNARGTEMSLPHGGLPEVVNLYLQNLTEQTGGPTGPIGLQFTAQKEAEAKNYKGIASDPLIEDQHLVPNAPGLVYKYDNRALWTITFKCAAYCRFCTRGREVGNPTQPVWSMEQIEQTLCFIKETPNLREIILSGGDPLTIDPKKLDFVLGRLGQMQNDGDLDMVRIGTRLPVHNPLAMKEVHYAAISKLPLPYIMVHINHPAELTPEALDVIYKLRHQCHAIIKSQTVLLKRVNNNEETLITLFKLMAKHGIEPYYVYQNDPVYWAEHYTVPFEEATKLWEGLRPKLSGLEATARFVIDTPDGYGKIPVPEGGAWEVNYEAGLTDFHGNRFKILE